MDEIGRRYLLLALRLGRHRPDLTHAFIGPPELREAVESEPRTPASELHDEALRLHEMVEELADDSPGEAARRRFLRTQLTALGVIARLMDGEEIPFMDFAEQLLDGWIEPLGRPVLDAARRELDRRLPGRGSPAERIAAHDAAMAVPSEHVVPTMEAFAALLRRRCAGDFSIPPAESVEWVGVRDRPYTAFARYLGHGRSRIEINLDLPFTLRRTLLFAAHEAYPGHHLERSTKEIELVEARDLGEAMILILATPESLVQEGAAEHALRTVLSDEEVEAELTSAATRLGIRGDVGLDQALVRARRVLGHEVVNAAIGRNRDGWSTETTRDYLFGVALVGKALAERGATLLDDRIRGTYLLCYPLGERLVDDWLAVTGRTPGYDRLLKEQLTPGILRGEIAKAVPQPSSGLV